MKNYNNRKNIIPHSKPCLGQNEVRRVTQVIKNGYIAEGDVTRQFEDRFSACFGFPDAVATSSGTSALHLILLAIGIVEKDEVVIPGFVCTALLNAVKYTGAVPVIADIIPDTYNIDPDDVKKRLTRKTKAIIVPHMFGLSGDMKSLLQLGVPVVEDCAQAIGGTYENKNVGTSGYAAVYSFYATKIIAAGEGGMVASSSTRLLNRVRDLKDYDNRDDYKVRFNYKMTDVHAAIGLSQLNRLDYFIKRRRAIAKRYHKAFEGIDVKIPNKHKGHIYFRYIIETGSKLPVWKRKILEKGVACEKPVYKPLNRYLGQKGFRYTEAAWRNCLSIPIYPSLSRADEMKVIKTVTETAGEILHGK